jgi:hypothetical protein
VALRYVVDTSAVTRLGPAEARAVEHEPITPITGQPCEWVVPAGSLD